MLEQKITQLLKPLLSSHKLLLFGATLILMAVLTWSLPVNSMEKPAPQPAAPQEAEEAPQPIVRVAPLYPARAARNGVEGFVIVRFRIDKAGTPKDIEVVESEPAGIFDREVVRAIERWRYEPAEHAEIEVRLDMRLGNE